MAMTANSPPKESLEAYEGALGRAYAAFDEAKTTADLALDAVEEARDEARSLYGTPEATSIFSDAISDAKRAAKAFADAINALPALDENDVTEEEGSAREPNS
jgi:selenocysteine lyase/cysteine desulfurase